MIQFRDSSKLFAGSLKDIARAYDLHTQKGEIDYRLDRRHNHIVTKEEKEYCFDDTRIVMELLLKMKDDKYFWKSQSASSYAMYNLMDAMFKGLGHSYTDKYKKYESKPTPYKVYRNMYPDLCEEETKFLRQGVEGGITYVTPNYQFKEINEKIIHVDAKQMHPSSAFANKFPFGTGEYFVGKPLSDENIKAVRIRISYDSVRLHSIIKLIGYDFLSNFELVVWDFEIPTMRQCYVGLEIEYIDGYSYKSSRLPYRNFYKDNFAAREEAKRNHNLFEAQRRKLLNNSSYGKLLEKPHNTYFENYVRPDGVIDSIVHDKEELEVSARYTYLPVGSAIPAYSRVALINVALSMGWKNIIYFDTDSIFAIANEEVETA